MDIQTAPSVAYDSAISLARQSLYRFSALSLLDPRAGCWERLAELRESDLLTRAAALVRNEPAAKAETLAPGERPLSELDPARVLSALPDSQSALNAEFEKTFGLLVSNACPPHEMEYINHKFTFQQSHTLGDISGFYHAFGFTLSTEHPERPDHISLELEFMALLLGLERQAMENADPKGLEHAEICREAQARFLREHLTWWAPAFSRLLGRENEGGFYDIAGVFLAALIAAERSLFGIDANTGAVRSTTAEQPEECEGCSIGP